MKIGIFKLLISILSASVLAVVVFLHLFLDDFLTSKINNFIDKIFETDSALYEVDTKLSNLSVELKNFYLRSPAGFYKSNLVEFETLSIQFDPSAVIKNVVGFKKVIIDNLNIIVFFKDGRFSSNIFLNQEKIKSKPESYRSPKFNFNSIEVRGLRMFIHSDNYSKIIKVPDFEIRDLVVSEQSSPPFVHFSKSLVKAILDEAKNHVETEILNELKIKFRKKLLERVGDKIRDQVSDKLMKLLNF